MIWARQHHSGVFIGVANAPSAKAASPLKELRSPDRVRAFRTWLVVANLERGREFQFALWGRTHKNHTLNDAGREIAMGQQAVTFEAIPAIDCGISYQRTARSAPLP